MIRTTWLGVDVGGPRKRFDVALIDDREVLQLEARLDRAAVAALVESVRPAVVAIDCPRRCAPNGQNAREGERRLRLSICGIYSTPDRARVCDNPFYEWIREGLLLYESLAQCGVEVIEVFPTASWTRWCGERGPQTRAAWTRQGVARLGLAGLPARNQDQRDAIAAAATARQHSADRTELFGDIVVPVGAL